MIRLEDSFTYSPWGKASEKERKIIKNEGENQIKAIEEHGRQLPESKEPYKKHDYDVIIFKQKQIFNKCADKRHDEILKLRNKIN